MNVPLIRMPQDEAREQLRHYRAQLHRRADEEYKAVAAGLAALADGTPILSLTQAIAAGGFDEKGRPRLGFARADRQQVRTWWERPNVLCYDSSAGTNHATRSLRPRASAFILFEVERWSDTRLDTRPDRDPYLLRHLHGDAYAVLAEWDLTPLEQLVMAGRRGN